MLIVIYFGRLLPLIHACSCAVDAATWPQCGRAKTASI